MPHSNSRPLSPAEVAFAPSAIAAIAAQARSTLSVYRDDAGRLGVASGDAPAGAGLTRVALLPPLYPEWLGSRAFCEQQRTRYAYIAGAMANGIASTALVKAMAHGGCLGFFGAAGLSLGRIETALDELQRELDPAGLPWGSNLIHNPAEPAHEEAVADLYLRRGVRCIEASAYLRLTPALIRYACSGLRQLPDGRIERPNRVIAKVSRAEVARQFLSPPSAAMLDKLQARGLLSAEEVALAQQLPLTEDLTAEADSGGHTDNRPLSALIPEMATLRSQIARERRYPVPIRIGAAGGLGTPAAVAAAFALGADYVQTGSVNQGCVEAGICAEARQMLAEVDMADVTMAPAADMFEMGVDVQVLKRGSLFAPRARRLYELYRSYPALEAIPAEEREKVENSILRASFEAAWASTRAFWQQRDPAQVARAERDAKHRMALVFRSYLGLASRWAIDGLSERRADYQIWCGPAMGAFNTWVKGSFLQDPAQRSAIQVARNLLEGATVVTRAQQLRSMGVPVGEDAFDFRPRPLA